MLTSIETARQNCLAHVVEVILQQNFDRVDSILHLNFDVSRICATNRRLMANLTEFELVLDHEPQHRQLTRGVSDGPIHSETNSLQIMDDHE